MNKAEIQLNVIKDKGLKWAENQEKKLKSKGWKEREIEDHILRESGKRFNIGTQNHIQSKFKYKYNK